MRRSVFPTLLVLPTLLLVAPPAHAHAFAERYDLPLPLWLYLVGAGAAVAFSFVIVAFFIRGHHEVDAYPRVDLLRFRVGRALASSFTVNAIRLVSVGLFVILLYAGFFGNQDNTFENIAPTLVWVIWWVGFAFLSALVGDVWALVNPWKAIAIWVEALVRRLDPESARSRGLELPGGAGAWPAVVLFFAFAWTELVWTSRGIPSSLATVIVVYSLITWLGMYLFGRDEWLRRGEAFTVIFGLFARFSPLEVRGGGTGDKGRREWNLRPYAVGLLIVRPVSLSMMIFVILTLSTVTLDGMVETPMWLSLSNWAFANPWLRPIISGLGGTDSQTVITTAGLVVLPILFFVVYAIFSQVMSLVLAAKSASGGAEVVSGAGPAALAADGMGFGERYPVIRLARLFVFSLVPIASAYHLAHFLSFLLIFGQLIIPLASDPFGFGWDIFGTADYQTNLGIVGTKFIWITSVVAIVLGHIAGVYLAHVMAMRAFGDRRLALLSQYPMLVLMVGYTMTSLWILSQPIVAS